MGSAVTIHEQALVSVSRHWSCWSPPRSSWWERPLTPHSPTHPLTHSPSHPLTVTPFTPCRRFTLLPLHLPSITPFTPFTLLAPLATLTSADDGLDHLAVHLDSSPHADHVASVTQTTTTTSVTTTTADDTMSTVKDGLREAYDKVGSW
jgi:hypothetical protein